MKAYRTIKVQFNGEWHKLGAFRCVSERGARWAWRWWNPATRRWEDMEMENAGNSFGEAVARLCKAYPDSEFRATWL